MDPSLRTRLLANAPRWAWGLYAAAWLLAPLLWHNHAALGLLSQIGIATIVLLSYNILLGQGGMLSFGHAVYSGAGAYLAIHSLRMVADGWPMPVVLVPLAGGLAGLSLALLLGWVNTRKAGMPFAMITLGLGELAWATALMFPGVFGGDSGIGGDRAAAPAMGPWNLGPALHLYYLIAVYTLLSTGLMYGFTRTPLGRLLNAVRDNPERVGFLGFDPQTVRYLAFAIAAFFAGISGGLAALQQELVGPDVLGSQRSATYLVFTVLGGAGFFAGPIVGAVLMVLAFAVFSDWTLGWLLYLGLIFGLVVMFAPTGVCGLLADQAPHRAWRRLRARPGHGLVLVLAALLGCAGVMAMVEMAYQLQWRVMLGAHADFLFWQLDSTAPLHWLGAGAAAVLGAGLAAGVSRRGAGTGPSFAGSGHPP